MEEIQKRVDQSKELLEHLLAFIDSNNDEDRDDCFRNLNNFLQKEINEANTAILRTLLKFLSNISKNHHRDSNLFKRIEHILLQFKDHIRKIFSDEEIVKYFQKDIQIVVFLLEKQIIPMAGNNFTLFYKGRNPNGLKNYYYIYPIIKESIGKRKRKRIEFEIRTNYKFPNIDEFIGKCQAGENDSDICQLIRNDSVEEFVAYVQKRNYPLNSKIPHSLFETNRFLIEKKETTLIEYASFYGSIQIIQYLQANNVELRSTMWLYSIHSNDPEMIHFLERNEVDPPEDSYELCLGEAIKCYHHEIARYIQEHYIKEKAPQGNGNQITEEECDRDVCSISFRYFNPEFLPHDFLEDNFLSLYLCEYNYTDFVKLLFQAKKLNANLKKITLDKVYHNPITVMIFSIALKNKNIEIINMLIECPNLKIDPQRNAHNNLKRITLPSITKIVDCLFYGCRNLREVTIPESVTTIGNGAFHYCGLKSVIIPSSVVSIGEDAFCECTALKQVTLPSSLKSIGNGAFVKCTSLEQITLPSSITSVAYFAFCSCRSLRQVTLPSSISSIENFAFADCTSLAQITLPSSITSIESSAFSNCTSLTQITLPPSMTIIRMQTFVNCTSLKQITLPSSLTSIENESFTGCTSLEQITLPSSITSIGYATFSGCVSLKKITLPPSLASIEDYLFHKCKSLKEVIIMSSVASIGKYAFAKCALLNDLLLPPNLTTIETHAFEKSGITSLIISRSVKTIKENAFSNCPRLKKITIEPSSIDTIKNGVFSNCTALTEVEIPSSVISIEQNAFKGCTALKQVTIPSSTSMDELSFDPETEITRI